MLRVSVLCFFASYVLAFGLEWTRFFSRGAAGRWLSLAAGLAGFVAQTLYLLLRSQQTHLPPLLSSMQDWLLVLAWLVVLIHLFVSAVDRELALGFVVWPLSLGLIAASRFSSDSAGAAANVARNWAMLHVALLVLGIAGVVLGFVVSLLYLWQHYRMKRGISPGKGFGLPSLERLARINRWALLVSAPLLTFGMLIGVGLALVPTSASGFDTILRDPVAIVSGICWLLMSGIFIWLVTARRPPGRQMAWMTAWACGFLLLTTVGAQVLTEVIAGDTVHGTANGQLRSTTSESLPFATSNGATAEASSVPGERHP